MKSKWMTDAILKSINTKDKLDTFRNQMDTEDEHSYSILKSEFITHRTVLRRNTKEAKLMYYTILSIFSILANLNKLWL